MKNKVIYYALGIIILLLSTPLGYATINVIYANQNLASEYTSLLNGFIHSYMIIGVLIFSIGLINTWLEKK